jgi:hypothetical protein
MGEEFKFHLVNLSKVCSPIIAGGRGQENFLVILDLRRGGGGGGGGVGWGGVNTRLDFGIMCGVGINPLRHLRQLFLSY